MTKRRVLFVDNDPDFLDTRAEFLENAGYRVLKANGLDEGRRLMAEAYIHLAILDIRLVDDDDEKDTSGLTLAKEPAYRAVPKIMLTNFPTYEGVREALGPALDGLSPAVDFVGKQEGAEAMVQAVERAFTQHVHTSWDLRIQGDRRERPSFLHLASLLQPDVPDHVMVQRASELEDLFRRLFYDYQQIRLGRLLWHREGMFCLPVLALSPQRATDARIVVCGERGHLEHAVERRRLLAPGRAQSAELAGTVMTIHFGAAAYGLPDAEEETLQTLRELFQSSGDRSLKAALNHLLKEVLAAWHQHGQEVDTGHDLMSLYRQWVGLDENGLSRAEVERRTEAMIQQVRPLSAVEIERGGGTITFHFPKMAPVRLPDPVETVYMRLREHDAPVICKISPGRLTADNVLVDINRRTWLTDFARAGQAPQWWDFVCAEAVIRFDLSQAPDLMAWQELEESLVAPDRLHDRLRAQDVIADLRTSVELIEQIRRQAGSETGPSPLPYYAGMLAWAVKAITEYDPAVLYTPTELMRGAHLLLAAGMLARRLGQTFSTAPVTGELRLVQDGTVWIGEYRVGMLGGQELTLLRCLYGRVDRLVSREQIVNFVFGEAYEAGDEHLETRINSLVRRLRVKIEPNPKEPRYVVTIKGRGYRLQVGGKPPDS
jgi:DNA-binding response OmpR family regulator